VALNLDRPHLRDVRVRHALLHALNRPGMMKAILHDRVKPLNSWMTPSTPYFVDAPSVYPYHVEKAKQLFAEAGWRPGAGGTLARDGQPFKLQFWGRTEDKQRELFMQAIQRDWKAVGVDSEIILQPSPNVFGKQGSGVISRRDFDAVIWQVSPFDANGGHIFWHGSQVPTPERQFREGENYFGWRNARADAALDKALGTLNEAERKAAYAEHQKLWLEDLPALPLFSHLLIHVTKSGIRNYKPTNSVRYPNTWNAHEWELAE
jgi:peptide/nickel transport system substrate-binding protein